MPCVHDPRLGERVHLSAYLIDFLHLTPFPPGLSSPCPCVQRFLEDTVALAQHLEPGQRDRAAGGHLFPFPPSWPPAWSGPKPALCSGHWRGGRYHLLRGQASSQRQTLHMDPGSKAEGSLEPEYRSLSAQARLPHSSCSSREKGNRGVCHLFKQGQLGKRLRSSPGYGILLLCL